MSSTYTSLADLANRGHRSCLHYSVWNEFGLDCWHRYIGNSCECIIINLLSYLSTWKKSVIEWQWLKCKQNTSLINKQQIWKWLTGLICGELRKVQFFIIHPACNRRKNLLKSNWKCSTPRCCCKTKSFYNRSLITLKLSIHGMTNTHFDFAFLWIWL